MSRPPCYLSLGAEIDAAAIHGVELESFSRPWALGQIEEVLREGRVAALRGLDSSVCAYCVFRRVAGELQIQTIAVASGLRRRGLACALLSWLLDAAARDGIRMAVLEVRGANEPARKLYERLGFRELVEKPSGSGVAPETAFILSLSLNATAPRRPLRSC